MVAPRQAVDPVTYPESLPAPLALRIHLRAFLSLVSGCGLLGGA